MRERADGPLQFRRDALRVMAGTLAGGMALFIVVLAVAVPSVTTLDLTILAIAVVAHGAVALTVGRRWEPGGTVNVLYVAFSLVLVLAGIANALTPASDAPWFLLVPIAIAAVSLPVEWQAVTTGLALAGFVWASALGPGVQLGYVAQRSTALVVFAIGMGVLTRRLDQALATADAAQAALRSDVADVTHENEELLRLDTARGDYVSSVSHELRTPLTVIVGMARTLVDRWDVLDDDDRRAMATRVAASSRTLVSIVGSLLDLARIERGGVEPEVAPVALDGLVTGTVDRLAPLLEDHRVVTAVPTGTTVATDARLLERVVDNLVTNAARHTPPGTTVTISADTVADGVRLEVRDDGPGIPADEVARLGEQFYRGRAARDRDGLGLGLALVVELLEALGHELAVTSVVGEGTTFRVVLPEVARVDLEH